MFHLHCLRKCPLEGTFPAIAGGVPKGQTGKIDPKGTIMVDFSRNVSLCSGTRNHLAMSTRSGIAPLENPFVQTPRETDLKKRRREPFLIETE
jgi:hypothetical protein